MARYIRAAGTILAFLRVMAPLRALRRWGKFPFIREIIGNFANRMLCGLFAGTKDAHVTGVWAKFPVISKPGIFWGEPGI
jgi:hypothetical protein